MPFLKKMEENTVVFDISSDEEPALDVVAGGDDFGWLTKLLCDDVDDSDEVVVVGEIKSKSSKVTANKNCEDDDDCVILDGDPDKPVAVDEDKADDGDDLVIVCQKGQIACRDYPHPRHLCAKFLFRSTAHETHCNLCHCYVCDTPAPCAHWGTGVNRIDHCHATEKEEFWKSQRKTFRQEKDAPLPVQVQVPDTSLSLPLPLPNQTPARDIIPLSSNSLPQNQVSRPAIIRGCSSSPRLTFPNRISQFRSRQPGPIFSRNRIPTRLVSQSPMHRVHSTGMFKRAAVAGGRLEGNQFVYGSSNIKSGYGSQCPKNPAPRGTSNDRIDVSWVPSMNHDSFSYQSTSQTGMGNVFTSTVPSQTQVYSQPLPRPDVYNHPTTQQLVYSQPIPEPQLYSQPNPQPQLYTQQSPLSNEGQNASELGNQVQNCTGLDLSEFDEWACQTNRSNQQLQVENCQLSRTVCINEPLPAEELNSQGNGSAKLHYNNFSEFENWYPDNQYGQVSEGYVPSDLDAVTPDPAAFDAGMLLFDFETSFNGLARA